MYFVQDERRHDRLDLSLQSALADAEIHFFSYLGAVDEYAVDGISAQHTASFEALKGDQTYCITVRAQIL